MGGAGGVKSMSQAGAFIFTFNLIVGVGALTLPIAFAKAGVVLGSIFLAFLGFISYATSTYMLEAQSLANYVVKRSEIELKPRTDVEENRDNNNQPLTKKPLFEIEKKTEMEEMFGIFSISGWEKRILSYIVVIYLFGDLSVYAASVPLTLASVTGGFSLGSIQLNEDESYHVYLLLFTLFVIGFAFYEFDNTVILQYTTLALRFVALFMMIIISSIFIGKGEGASTSSIPLFQLEHLPALFGVSVYSFMCHHSLPGIITPVTNKKGIGKVLVAVFIAVYTALLALCLTTVYAFGDIKYEHCSPHPSHPCYLQQLITLNFESFDNKVIAKFLSLFPVFTLTANFPLISITLRNNLYAIYKDYENEKKKRLGSSSKQDNPQEEVPPTPSKPDADSECAGASGCYQMATNANLPTSEGEGNEDRFVSDDHRRDEEEEEEEELDDDVDERTPILSSSSPSSSKPAGKKEKGEGEKDKKGEREKKKDEKTADDQLFKGPSWPKERIIFPLCATLPPIIIAFATKNVDLLVSVTGGYAGLGIMFFIPIRLLVHGRMQVGSMSESIEMKRNPTRSLWGRRAFFKVLYVWIVIALGLSTYNLAT